MAAAAGMAKAVLVAGWLGAAAEATVEVAAAAAQVSAQLEAAMAAAVPEVGMAAAAHRVAVARDEVVAVAARFHGSGPLAGPTRTASSPHSRSVLVPQRVIRPKSRA